MTIHKCYLQLGSNVGDSISHLNQAVRALSVSGVTILTESAIYLTEAWGNTDQQAFHNQIVLIETHLLPFDLLQNCLAIERSLGRVRSIKWEPRIIDIDMLFYSTHVLLSENLKIPHQHIANRRFILEMMMEMDSALIHPVYRKSIQELLDICKDTLKVTLIS